ncbi:hypothetical protein NliqN6_3728 [Naganishia liquefaciens]|uniref:Hap4 transcription factor heteromerisation domain-containing protein n=1 Tax=Naganishia liquefaciens TaxID=104408 RepID=A0A8H3YH57_9TREE|nr:hypothetical protein NliqN6_3728 [Naganishia liquefaciens]
MSKENSSSAGVLFAKPTKEWVVPQRAKPGRKSTKQPTKTDVSSKIVTSTISSNDPEARNSAGNRDAQRAFRERKTEYVASLEARIEAYEKGEISRNVALQVSARATKEENVRLKADLEMKTQELAVKDDRCKKLEKVVVELRRRLNAATEVARKLSSQTRTVSRGSSSASRRGSDAFSTILGASSPGVSTSSDGMKMDMPISPPDYDRESNMYQSASTRPPLPSRAYSSSHRVQKTDVDYRAMSVPQSQNHRIPVRGPLLHSTPLGSSTSVDLKITQTQSCGNNNNSGKSADDFVPCGFCSGMESICVCRSIEENDKTLPDTSPAYFDKSQNGNQIYQAQSGIDSIVNAAKHQEAVSQSILENLPAPEPAVPLRRRRARASGTETSARLPIFAVQPLTLDNKAIGDSDVAGANSGIFTSSSGFESGVIAMMQDKENGLYIPPAECSGDPKNCPACKDDDFGREFCETLSTAVCNPGDPNHRCENCADKPLPLSQPRMNAYVVTTTSNARGSASDSGSVPPPDLGPQASDGMEFVDIPCCGDKQLCGATFEEDCKTSIAIPIISTEAQDTRHRPPLGSVGKVRGLAGGQEGSWLETEKWIGKEPLGADQAWRTLKAHPNAKSCPLSMLAEVVARGTRYTFSPSRTASPAPSTADQVKTVDDTSSIAMVPLEELEAKAKRRRFEIHPDAVQNALAMLDAHPSRPNKKRRLSDIRDVA